MWGRKKKNETLASQSEPEALESAQEVEDEPAPESAGFDRSAGPLDSDEFGDRGKLLDAGSLWLPALQGANIHFSLKEGSKQVLGVMYVFAETVLQLQVYAAPKSRGIWDEVRLDMRTSIAQQGGRSDEADGPLGKELRAVLPAPNGQPGFAAFRYLGIDGPRWLLRATIYGRGIGDPALNAKFEEVVRAVVVNRGSAPYPPREMLELKVPQVAQAKQA